MSRTQARIPGMLLLVALGTWGATTLERVAPGEVVVVRRLGRFLPRTWSSGLHVGWPLGFERRERVRVAEVRLLSLTEDERRSRRAGDDEYLTGDQNLALFGIIVQYRVADPFAFVSSGAGRTDVLRPLAEESLALVVSSLSVEEALRSRRPELARRVREQFAARCDRLGLGLEVMTVAVVEARPPDEVAEAFAEAQAARVSVDRRAEESRLAVVRVRTGADERARSIVASANSDSGSIRSRARSTSARFLALLGEVRRDRAETLRRLLHDALRGALSRPRKRLIVPDGEAVDLSILGGR